ncbi:MAG TPA: squalene--hopene cyclase, partial [Pirellulales bacterium]
MTHNSTLQLIASRRPFGRRVWACCAVVCLLPHLATAQDPTVRYGETVPRDVREMYDRGLQYLATSQQESGEWGGGQNNRAGNAGVGATALGLLVLLASGEDPNFGLYSSHVRRGLRNLILAQGADTGIIGSSMYEHGFATLALAEAYGAVDDRNLWAGVT